MFNRSLVVGGTVVAASFVAAIAAAAPLHLSRSATAQADVDGGHVVVRGRAFFPIMLIDQCDAGAAARAKSVGVNLIVDEACPRVTARVQLSRLRGRVLAVLPVGARTARGRSLAGWAFPDEPEDNGWTPARLRRVFHYRRGSRDGLLSFVTTGAGFSGQPYSRSSTSAKAYGAFARVADVAGFDLYPLDHCSSNLAAVYDAQRAFQRLAGSMPTFQWIETGPLRPRYCGGYQMQPAQLRAEVWLAIAGGARGIGYFTHAWTPLHRAFAVTAPIRHEMRRIDDLIAAVRPGLVGVTLLSGVNSPSLRVLARAGGGRTWVFVVNPLGEPATVQVHVPALRDGTVRVFGERRSLSARGGRFVDSFAPLGVHVYVQRR